MGHCIHIIVGRKNHGKTARSWTWFGNSAAAAFGLERSSTPGMRMIGYAAKRLPSASAGGRHPAAILTKDSIGVFLHRNDGDDCHQRLAPLFADCELVLVEGDIEAGGINVEIWRQALGTPSLATECADIAAARPTIIPRWRSRSGPGLAWLAWGTF